MRASADPKALDLTLLVWAIAFPSFLITVGLARPLLPAESRSLPDACGTQTLPATLQDIPIDKSHIIAVVGDGVPGQSLVIDRPYNTQFAQGYDLYQGVRHAIAHHAEDLLQSVFVLYVDDGGNPECSRQIAGTIATDPRLLAVIGHSTTASTRAALPIYRKKNIPLLIPAATSPSIDPENSHNWFRLPSNDSIQSIVIADVILNQLKAKTLLIVWDATPEASQYAGYLKKRLQHLLSLNSMVDEASQRLPLVEGVYPISLNPQNYTYLYRRIVSSRPDVVVFAGYGSLAREFLFGLDLEYQAVAATEKPTIILTDGCKLPGLDAYGFDALLAFAAQPLADFAQFDSFEEELTIGRFQRLYLEESFEVFSYDATMLLLTSIRQLAGAGEPISRQLTLDRLPNAPKLAQTAYNYSFESGENFNHRYFVYSLRENGIRYRYDESRINSLLRRRGED